MILSHDLYCSSLIYCVQTDFPFSNKIPHIAKTKALLPEWFLYPIVVHNFPWQTFFISLPILLFSTFSCILLILLLAQSYIPNLVISLFLSLGHTCVHTRSHHLTAIYQNSTCFFPLFLNVFFFFFPFFLYSPQFLKTGK